jgi:hypothetical protein
VRSQPKNACKPNCIPAAMIRTNVEKSKNHMASPQPTADKILDRAPLMPALLYSAVAATAATATTSLSSLQFRDDKLASTLRGGLSGGYEDLKGGAVRRDRKKPVPSNQDT